MTVGITHLLLVSAGLVGIGLYGLMARREVVAVLAASQLLVAGIDVALVAFARFGFSDTQPLAGMVLALVVMSIALAQVAVGVGLALLLQRRRGTAMVDELDELRG